MALAIKKVLISDAVDASCVKILENHGVQVTLKTDYTKPELLQAIQGYDGLIVRSATKVTSDVIKAGQSLKVIGRAGTGVDNIDCDAATRQGILVINSVSLPKQRQITAYFPGAATTEYPWAFGTA